MGAKGSKMEDGGTQGPARAQAITGGGGAGPKRGPNKLPPGSARCAAACAAATAAALTPSPAHSFASRD